MIESAFESVHGFLRGDRLGTNLITYLEIERDVFGSRWKEL